MSFFLVDFCTTNIIQLLKLEIFVRINLPINMPIIFFKRLNKKNQSLCIFIECQKINGAKNADKFRQKSLFKNNFDERIICN